MRQWASHLWYAGISDLGRAASLLAWSYRTEGGRHIPPSGPALLLANHQCFLDPLFIGICTRRRLCYLARKTLWRSKPLGLLIESLNAVPVDQEGVAKEGLKAILAQMEKGEAVLVFPEGQRTMTGEMNDFRPGVHLLIKRQYPPIVPIGIAGAYHAWPRWRSYPLPSPLFLPPTERTIAVSVGEPIDSRRYQGMKREAVLADLQIIVQQMWRKAERLRRK